MAGSEYTIADIITYPWVVVAVDNLIAMGGDRLGEAPNVKRWIGAIGARPAVQKGMAIPTV